MKRMRTIIAAASLVVVMASAGVAQQIITKQGNTTVVNTTELTKNTRGFHGPTPVKIYIKNNKITKVVALKNQESPEYFRKARMLLNRYKGKSVNRAQTMKVDAVSGATYSSKALVKNVQAGLKYYQQQK